MDIAYLRHAFATALRVARFDKDAVAGFDHSFEGFFRSFYGIVLCAPLYAVILYAERRIAVDASTELPSLAMTRLPPPTLAYYAVESVSYLAGWLALPVAMIGIVRLLGATSRYVPFVVAYNWTACIILAASTIPYALYLVGIVPLVGVVTMIYPIWMFALIYRWRVARDALQISNMNAAGIAILDFLLGLLVVLAAARMRGAL